MAQPEMFEFSGWKRRPTPSGEIRWTRPAHRNMEICIQNQIQAHNVYDKSIRMRGHVKRSESTDISKNGRQDRGKSKSQIPTAEDREMNSMKS